VDYEPGHFRPGDRLEGRIWVINDLAREQPGCQVEVLLRDSTGQPTERFSQMLDVAGDSARIVGRVAWTLPPGQGWRLSCQLKQDGQILSSNEYDLGAHDGIQPTLRQRLRSWLTGLVRPA
jgi:hypothetical protein